MSKSIPKRPNLDFDRKQAKILFDQIKRADSEAVARFLAHHPGGVPKTPKLGDAQLVVAREYGFPSWPGWKSFVETRSLDRARQAEIILHAVCSNDIARARVLLQADPDLARENFPLACACGEEAFVTEALKRQPALATHRGGVNGWDPIQYACFSRWLRCDPQRSAGIVAVVGRLLAAGADPNAFHTVDWMEEPWKETVLFAAAGIANNPTLTGLLLAAGADVNEERVVPDPADPALPSWGGEALYHASEFRDTTCLRLLLEAGPHASAVSYCLGRALDFEYPDSIRLYLKHGADPNFRVPWMKNRTHFHRAVESGRSPAILRMLRDAGGDASLPDADGVTPFRTAIRYGREDLAGLLDVLGREKSTEEDRALGLLMQGRRDEPMAVRVDPDMLCAAARRNDTDLIDRLIRSGADVNACDSGQYGVPPLHWAAWRGRFAAVRSLVAHGADIHSENPYGGDALGAAIHGSANCFDAEGGPAMRLPEEALAGDYPQIVEFLISCGARLPDRISGGSETVADVLRHHGVPDEVEPSTATGKQ